MAIKMTLFRLAIICSLGLFPLTGFAQQKEIMNIDLNEAKRTAEKYIEFEKHKDYQSIIDMQHIPPDCDQEKIEKEKKAVIVALKVYADELGDIIDYHYKSYEWQDERKWTSGEIELPSLTIIYAVKYTKHTTDRTITIIKKDDELKIDKFGVLGPMSWEINQKIMKSLME